MIKLLFVCLGNICRSPALAGYMGFLVKEKNLEDRVYVDSCGLYATFLGSQPDGRMKEVAHSKGIHLDHQAKLFQSTYFEMFDAIFGVTGEVVAHLRSLAQTKEALSKIYHVTDFSVLYRGRDIPDPYYLGKDGFEKAWEMIEDVCQGIFEHFIAPKS